MFGTVVIGTGGLASRTLQSFGEIWLLSKSRISNWEVATKEPGGH